jgi:hypothetical protein
VLARVPRIPALQSSPVPEMTVRPLALALTALTLTVLTLTALQSAWAPELTELVLTVLQLPVRASGHVEEMERALRKRGRRRWRRASTSGARPPAPD